MPAFPGNRVRRLAFRVCPFAGASLLLALSLALGAQQPDAAAPPTFHIATDLLQIPVLVLSNHLRPLPPIDPHRFVISIASGPPFHPAVRPEGDDPIALTLVLDTSGPQRDLLARLPAALAAALPGALHPRDTLAIDTLDHCVFNHVLAPSLPTANSLSQTLQQALTSPPAQLELHRARCGSSVKLWDGLAYGVDGLSRQSGRRVLLAITNGNDTASSTTWNQLRIFAGSRAVTLFSLSDPADDWRQHLAREILRADRPELDVLSGLTQLTGGLSLETSPDDLAGTLSRLVAMVRGRYIIEFPRPDHFKGALNGLDVRLTGMHAFIRTSGIGFPPQDPSQAAPDGRLPRPIPGDRVILTSP